MSLDSIYNSVIYHLSSGTYVAVISVLLIYGGIVTYLLVQTFGRVVKTFMSVNGILGELSSSLSRNLSTLSNLITSSSGIHSNYEQRILDHVDEIKKVVDDSRNLKKRLLEHVESMEKIVLENNKVLKENRVIVRENREIVKENRKFIKLFQTQMEKKANG